MFLLGNFKKAEEYYLQGINILPPVKPLPGHLVGPGVSLLKNLAILYQRTNQQQKSIETWHKLKEIAPDDPDVKKVFTST